MARTLAMARELTLLHAQHTKKPVFLHGPTGIGKSDIMYQIADEEFEGNIIDLRVILLESVDLRGLPKISEMDEEAIVKWIAPEFMPNERRHGEVGMLFLDELSAAPQNLQAACYPLVLNRRLGEYKLPKGWYITAAGNRPGVDKSVAYRMSKALANRFAHVEVEPDLDTFIKHANHQEFHEMVVAFLRSPMGADKLHMVPDQDNVLAFPTPRTYEDVSRFLIEAPDCRPAVRLAMLESLIGEGPGRELDAFIQLYDQLPDIDDIIARPNRAIVPEDMSQKYAVSTALGRKAERRNWDNILTYAERLGAEYEMLIARDATDRDGSLANTKAYSNFLIRNKDFRLS